MSTLGPEASSTNAKLCASSPLLGFDLCSFVEAAQSALEADNMKGQARPNRRRRGTSIPNSLLVRGRRSDALRRAAKASAPTASPFFRATRVSLSNEEKQLVCTRY